MEKIKETISIEKFDNTEWYGWEFSGLYYLKKNCDRDRDSNQFCQQVF